MPVIIQYLLKLFISLALVYIFYQLVLRKLTFYTGNRWYLLLYSLISFIIPFINIDFLLEKNQWKNIEVIHYIPLLEKYTVEIPAAQNRTTLFGVWNIVTSIMLVGIFIMLIRLLIQFWSVRKIRRSAILLHKEDLKLYHVDRNIIPFSFGNAIYVNRGLHSEDDLKEIIRHEFVHVKQRHSIDVLWSEILCIINWYNPFAWMLRKAIRQNLEFIADNNIIQSGFDRKQYQFLLLKVTGVSNFSIANQFNYSSLKKRIAMMNKMKSARLNLLRFLFVLPLVAVLLLAFRKNQVGNPPIIIQQSVYDTLPTGNSSVSLHRDDEMDKEQKTFFDKNPSVLLLHWNISKGTIEIFKKNGEVEKYDLLVNLNQAETTYGKIPFPLKKSSTVYYSTNGDINKKGYYIEMIEVNGHSTILVKNKTKKIIESVNLLQWEEKKNYYENLYGVLPSAPPAPQPPLPAKQVTVAVSAITTPQISQATVVETNTKQIVAIANSSNTQQVAPVIATTTSVRMNTPNIAQVAQVNAVSQPVISSTISTTVATQGKDGQYEDVSPVIGPEGFRFEIYRSTTREELNQMISKAKEKGATLTFDDIKYNEKNQLVSLSGTIKNKNDKSNFNATDFQKVILTMVQKDGHSHIYIMVTDKEVS